MAKAKKVTKKVKKPANLPKVLSVSEVLEIEGLLHELSMLRKDTELLKANIDLLQMKKKTFEQEVIIQTATIASTQVELKDHGIKVMEREKAYNSFRERLCTKYKVENLSYDPDTLELI